MKGFALGAWSFVVGGSGINVWGVYDFGLRAYRVWAHLLP